MALYKFCIVLYCIVFVYGAILHIRAAKSGKLGQARGHPYRSAGRVNLQMASGNSSQESSSRRRAREATTAPLSVDFPAFAVSRRFVT